MTATQNFLKCARLPNLYYHVIGLDRGIMREIERIIDHYDRVMRGSAWHGDPVWKILEGITAQEAARRPIGNAHNIWELVMHVTYWETVACQRIRNLPSKYSKALNFPPTPKPGTTSWNRTLKAFRASNRAFRDTICRLDSATLDNTMPRDRRKSFYREVHGVIQHHIYHAGQIALLKKALADRRSS